MLSLPKSVNNADDIQVWL